MGTQDVRCGGTAVRRPRELDLSARAGHSKDLGFETVSTRQQDHAPLLRFLMLVTASPEYARGLADVAQAVDQS